MSRTVVVAGVGPGLGASLASRFADEGCQVALFARSADYLDELAADLSAGPGSALAVPTNLRDLDAVRDGFETVREQFGPVDVLVYNASASAWAGLTDCSASAFQRTWEVTVRGAFACSQEAVDDMLAGDGGTVLFTGATSSVRGRGGAVDFSSAKFALRGMAESMARELGPDGVHVAHVVVDGQIRPPDGDVDDPGAYLDPDAIADSYWALVEQDRSAWTLELDVRPHVEEF